MEEQNKGFLKKIGVALASFWQYIKPKLRRFHQKRKHLWKKYHIHKIFILAVLIVSLIGSVYLLYLAKTANVSALQDAIKTSSTIYDEDGNVAGTLYSQKGTFVTIDQISPYIKESVVNTEDKRFYQHGGFDMMGIGRAAVGYVTSGGVTGGGSTLTQQLAKNAFLTQKQTLSRKAEELFLAIELEKQYSKDEILEMYLNNSYFGNGVWGVEDASQKYFGKSASEVSLSEAAILTAILKSPSYYNPIDNMEHAVERRNVVVNLLLENGVIGQEEADAAKNSEVILTDTYVAESGYNYPYYFDAVIDEAVNKYGLKEEDIMNKGYRIYTTLNQTYQQNLELTYANDYNFPEAAADGVPVQSATVMMDPKTGGVYALVGGRGEHMFRGFNRATQTQVQPGSALKPIAVYAPALANGYKFDSILPDAVTSYGSDNYTPENAMKTYQGEVTLSTAVYQSLNAPAVWLLNDIGLEKGYQSVEKFGIPLTDDDHYLGLALGGMTKGVSPMQMASAYTAFANEGIRSEGYLITKIVDATGAIIIDNTKPKTNRAISSEVASEMTSILIGSFNNGIAYSAKPDGYTVAGKTGSTELTFGDSTGTKDQWVVGYTPDIVTATWMGFDNTDEAHYLEGISTDGVAVVFKDAMSNVLPYSPLTAFSETDATSMIAEKEEQANNEEKGIWDSVVDGAKEVGEKIKDGAEVVGDKAKEAWNGLKGLFE